MNSGKIYVIQSSIKIIENHHYHKTITIEVNTNDNQSYSFKSQSTSRILALRTWKQNISGELNEKVKCFSFQSCAHVKSANLPSGIYKLQPEGREFEALCDSMTDGGGWTIIQKF